MKKVLIGIALVSLLVMAGCSNGITGGATSDISFKERCMKDGNMFMTMGPVIDGVPTGEPPCPGCMYANGHYCDEEDYIKARNN